MKRLNEHALRVGDIILSTTATKLSKAVRVGTWSDISHAMLYVEDYSVIDATGEGVQARNTQRLLFGDSCPVHVLRLVNQLPEDQVRRICQFARAQVGTQYSVKEAVQTRVGGRRNSTKKQFCSRLVAQAYASVGINLVDDPNFCSPAGLKDSSLLIHVTPPTVPVTPEEIAQWEGRANIPQMMRDATNAVLDGARKKSKDIQTFDDLDRHLMQHPEDDAYFCGLLEKSGYLTIWKVEQEKNPWQYDLDLMKAFSSRTEGIDEYCLSLLLNEEAGPNRYILNRGAYASRSKQFGLRSFELMEELYSVLATLHRKRLLVATRWLDANSLLGTAGATTATHLVPHTSEWFTALAIWDPPQALMTKAAIGAAGRIDVCSICGDDPAHDYRLKDGHRPPAGVDTLRLCDDCLEIRRMMGDPFVPLLAMPEN